MTSASLGPVSPLAFAVRDFVPAPGAITSVLLSTVNIMSLAPTLTVTEFPLMAVTVPRAVLVSSPAARNLTGKAITESARTGTAKNRTCLMSASFVTCLNPEIDV